MSEYQTVRFSELRIGQGFDWIDPAPGAYNSFYRPCVKTSTRGYQDDRGVPYRVGSVRARVFHVSEGECSSPDSASECAMIRERQAAGVSDTIPACPVHGEYSE